MKASVRRFLRWLGVVAVITVSAVIFALQYNKVFTKDLIDERVSKIQQYSSATTGNLIELYGRSFALAESAEAMLRNMPAGDTSELIGILQSFIKVNPGLEMRREIVAVASASRWYSAYGDMGELEPGIRAPEGEARTAFTIRPATIGQDRFLVFCKSLAEPIPVGSEDPVTAIALVINTSDMEHYLDLSSLGPFNMIYVVDGDGHTLFMSHDGRTHDNYAFDAREQLRRTEFGEEAVEHFQNVLDERYKDSLYTEHSEHIIQFDPIGGTDWTSVLIVRADGVGTNTNYYLSRALYYFLCFVILCFSVVAITGIAVYRVRVKQRLVDRQREINDELEKNNALLLEAVNRANEANHAKSDFLSHMSHDIRTPINGIMGMTSIGLKNLDNPDRTSDCFKKIDASSRHLLSLVNDILDMSRIESGKEHINRRPLSVPEMLNHVSSIICGQIVDRNIDFVTRFDIEHTEVIGDDLHIRQILLNILGNAIKFTPDGGRVTFSAEEAERDPEGKWILYKFVVADTGIGMSPDFVQHAFEPFAQAENSARTSYQGTGLGLTITKQFVDMLDGSISVKSVLGKGTAFTVTIPIDINVEASQNKEEELQFAQLIRGRHVLIAEDNDLNAEVVEAILDEAGVTYELAVDGQEAVNMFRDHAPHTYDAILMDIMMPVKDGLEATREIRSMARQDAAGIPIIAVTANAYEEDMEKTRAAGMNAHIAKPVAPDILYKAIYNYTLRDKDVRNSLRGLCILLAEDNDLNAEIVRELLAEEGVTVRRAINGAEAFALFSNCPPGTFDVILMDIQMPVMGGIEATRVIRHFQRSDAVDIPIIAMTANAYDEDVQATREAGMNAHLSKPIEINKLMEVLKHFT